MCYTNDVAILVERVEITILSIRLCMRDKEFAESVDLDGASW